MKQVTRRQFQKALKAIHPHLHGGQLKMLRSHFHARGRETTASELAAVAGYVNYRGVNLQYGRVGVLLRAALGLPRAQGRTPQLGVFADIVAWHPDGDYGLRLRQAFFDALNDVNWFGSAAGRRRS